MVPYLIYVRKCAVHLFVNILGRMETLGKSRLDTRLSKEQKEYFEYAARLGGFKSLTAFVMFSMQQQANSIVEKHQTILASKRDRDVFFHAILNPPKPNAALRKAAMRYKEATAGK